MDDPLWQDVSKYGDGKAILNGEIGKIWKVRFVETTRAYTETVAGVYNEDAPIHVSSLIGKEAYGVAGISGKEKKIYVKTPEQLAQPIPLFGTIGWYVPFAAECLNACFGVNILCGATK
jgi:N4-gp56 family major capsid protein